MPLYEYQCKKCNHRFEKIQKFSDPETKECPKCGGEAERLLSAPSVQFKGSGWYVTDYAKKAGPSSPSSSNSNSSSSDKSSSGNSDTGKKTESSPAKTDNKS